MMNDALTNFLQPGSAQSVVGAAGTEIVLGQVLDLLGVGVGVAPPAIIGNIPAGQGFGHDPGVGRVKPELQINVGTAFTTGNGATATFRLEYAEDNGSNNPGTWYTSSETNAHAVAQMTANQVIRMDITPAPVEAPNPRFVRVTVYPGSGANFSAGTVTFAGEVFQRDDLVNRLAPNNFTVA